MQPALLVTTGDGGGFQFTVFRGCWAAVYRQCLLSLLLTITCIRELRYKEWVIQFVHPIVNCPPPSSTVQAIACLSRCVRCVYTHGMLQKAQSDIPVIQQRTAFYFPYLAYFCILTLSGSSSYILGMILLTFDLLGAMAGQECQLWSTNRRCLFAGLHSTKRCVLNSLWVTGFLTGSFP
jgi:hypothetical protein